MPKRIPPLTELKVRNVKPKDREYKLFDGYGLQLVVKPTGAKLWRAGYRFLGKEKSLSLGAFPDVSLDEARHCNNEIRRQLAHGINPSQARKEEQAREKAKLLEADSTPSVRVCIDGMIEIWKGRSVVRLTKEEYRFVRNLLIRMR
jgi:hypothetical protein